MNHSAARLFRDIMLGALLLCGVAACTWQGIQSEDTQTRRLYISGHSAHVADADIARLAAPYLKASYFDLDLKALQDTLAAQPWLTDVRVSRHFPSGVVVDFADHKPVAYWGDDAVLAADGSLFKPEPRPSGLVQLDGPENTASKVHAQYEQLSGILASHDARLASLTLDASGDWQAHLDNGLVLRLGREQLAQRMQRFVQFALNRRAVQKALSEAGYVDLRYSDGFAVGGQRRNMQTASTSAQENMG